MRILGLLTAAVLFLPACGSGGEAPAAGNEAATPSAPEPAAPAPVQPPAAAPAPAPATTAPAVAGARWDLQSSGEGVALALLPASGSAVVRLFCPAGRRQLLANVPGFRPVGSEERLSFGSGGAVAALVADTRGDTQRGGVSGTGPVPADLAALIAGPVSASYGAQTSGPHPAPPANLAKGFAAACQDRRPVPAPAEPPKPAPASASPCMVQDGKALAVAPLRAVGTEPFWGARVEGRCVTYSHPDDQKGTRVWTRYTPGSNGRGTWSGALGGKPFALTARPAPGCSDGMSDRRYPIAVDLLVSGERRKGCAAPP